ncbi:MAG: hypothetical protein HY719_04480 [Planctomycetes bacterium]|nr:hypothetical protein [Planctomycetota bacterium]
MKKFIIVALLVVGVVAVVANKDNIKKALNRCHEQSVKEDLKHHPEKFREALIGKVAQAEREFREAQVRLFKQERQTKEAEEALVRYEKTLEDFGVAVRGAKESVAPDMTLFFAGQKYTLPEAETQAKSWLSEYISQERIVADLRVAQKTEGDVLAAKEQSVRQTRENLATLDRKLAEYRASLAKQEARQRAIDEKVFDENGCPLSRCANGDDATLAEVESLIKKLENQNAEREYVSKRLEETTRPTLEQASANTVKETKETADARYAELYQKFFGGEE